jgi:hypothetical protein
MNSYDSPNFNSFYFKQIVSSLVKKKIIPNHFFDNEVLPVRKPFEEIYNFLTFQQLPFYTDNVLFFQG